MLDIHSFEDIVVELKRKSLDINRYRSSAGEGKSQTFGIVGKRCLPSDYSRQCWLRPKLYHHLLEFGKNHVDISWNAITINENYKAEKHRDKNNIGPSMLVAFGSYEGGDLLIHEGDLSGSHDIFHKPIITDFSKVLHSVAPWTGDRYSLVYYWYHQKKNKSHGLIKGEVRIENGIYYFYRGGVKIIKSVGLPHPLKGRIRHPQPVFMKVEEETVISFK